MLATSDVESVSAVVPGLGVPVVQVATPVDAPAPPVFAPAPADAPAPPVDPDAIIVTAHKKPPKEDPLQAVNEKTFAVVDAVDHAVIRPVSTVYEHAIPRPVRTGLRNFLNNLREPIIFLNFILQVKPGRAAETLGRFVINSTVGIGGLVDVAIKRPFNLKPRANGFAFTLGFYGVKPGAFLFLPLIGPTTVRDLIGRTVDIAVLPSILGKPFNRPAYALATNAFRVLDERVEKDQKFKDYRSGPVTPYAAERADYLAARQSEIDELRLHRWWVHERKSPVTGQATPLCSSP